MASPKKSTAEYEAEWLALNYKPPRKLSTAAARKLGVCWSCEKNTHKTPYSKKKCSNSYDAQRLYFMQSRSWKTPGAKPAGFVEGPPSGQPSQSQETVGGTVDEDNSSSGELDLGDDSSKNNDDSDDDHNAVHVEIPDSQEVDEPMYEQSQITGFFKEDQLSLSPIAPVDMHPAPPPPRRSPRKGTAAPTAKTPPPVASPSRVSERTPRERNKWADQQLSPSYDGTVASQAKARKELNQERSPSLHQELNVANGKAFRLTAGEESSGSDDDDKKPAAQPTKKPSTRVSTIMYLN